MAAAAAAAADQTGIPLTREGAAVATETEKKSFWSDLLEKRPRCGASLKGVEELLMQSAK